MLIKNPMMMMMMMRICIHQDQHSSELIRILRILECCMHHDIINSFIGIMHSSILHDQSVESCIDMNHIDIRIDCILSSYIDQDHKYGTSGLCIYQDLAFIMIMHS